MQMTVDLYAHVREDRIREEMGEVMDMMSDSNDRNPINTETDI